MIPRDKKLIQILIPLGLLFGVLSFPCAPAGWEFLGAIAAVFVLGVLAGRIHAPEEDSARSLLVAIIFCGGFLLAERIFGRHDHWRWDIEHLAWVGQFTSIIALSMAVTLIGCSFFKRTKSQATKPPEATPG